MRIIYATPDEQKKHVQISIGSAEPPLSALPVNFVFNPPLPPSILILRVQTIQFPWNAHAQPTMNEISRVREVQRAGYDRV